MKHPIYQIPIRQINAAYDVSVKILYGVAIVAVASLIFGGAMIALVKTISRAMGGMQ